MSSINLCDQCKVPMPNGVPIYYIDMGLKQFMNKSMKKGDLCYICYQKIDQAITKVRDEVRKQ